MSFQSSSLSSSTYSSLAYDYDNEGIGKGMCGQAVLSKLRPRYYNKRSQRALLKRSKKSNGINPIELKPINTLFVTEGEYLYGTTSGETNSNGNNSREGGGDDSIKSGPSLKMIAQFDVKTAMEYQVPAPEEESDDEEEERPTPKSTPSNTPKSSNRRFDFEAHDNSLLLEREYHQKHDDFHNHNSQDGYYHHNDNAYDDDVSCYSDDEDDADNTTDNTDFYLRNAPPSPRSSKASPRGRQSAASPRSAGPIPERVMLLSTLEEATDDDDSRDTSTHNTERPSPIGATALSDSMHASERRGLSGSNHGLSESNHGLSGSIHVRSLSGSNHGAGSMHARSLSGSNHGGSGIHSRSLSGSNHGSMHASTSGETQQKRSISPVSASRAAMEDEDTLVTMRAMLMRQQQTLLQLEAKNRAYRERLSASHNRVQEVRKDQLNSKDAIIKLQFERESFEAEAVWLREELKKMKSNNDVGTREEREADEFFDELEGKAKSEVRWSRTGILHHPSKSSDKSTCVEEPESPASSHFSSQLPHQRTSDLLQAMSSEYELSVVSSSSFERDLKGTRRALKSNLRIITSDDDDVEDEAVDSSTVTELGAPGASFESELKYHRKMLHSASPSKLKSDVSTKSVVSFESPLATSSRGGTQATTPHSRVTPQSRANTSTPNIREAAASNSEEDTAPETDFERSLRETRQALQSKQRSKPISKEDLKAKFAERTSVVSSQSQMSPSRRDSMIMPLGTSLDRSSHSAASRPNPIMVPKVAQSEEEGSLVSPLGASLDRSSRIVPQLAQRVQSERDGPLVSPLGASLDRSSHSARSQPKPRSVPQLAQSEEEDSLVSPSGVSLDRSTTPYSVRSQPKARAVPKSTQSEGGGSLVSSLVGLKYSTPQSVASQQHQQTRFGGDGSLISSPLGVSLDCSSLQSMEADAVEVLLTKVASLEISRSSPEPETENPCRDPQKDPSKPSFSKEPTTQKDSLPAVSPSRRSPRVRGRSTSPAVRSPRFFPPSPTSGQRRDDASASSNRSSSLGRLQQGSPSRRQPRYFSQVGNAKREPSSPASSNNANWASSPRKSPRKSPRYFWEVGSLTDGEDSTVASTPQSKYQASPTKRSARFFSEEGGEKFEQHAQSPPPRSPRTRRSPSPSPKAARDKTVWSRVEDHTTNHQEHFGATRRSASKSPRASERKRGDPSRGVPQQEPEMTRGVASSKSVNSRASSPSPSYLNREHVDQQVAQDSDSLRPEAGNRHAMLSQRTKSPHPSSVSRGPGSQWVDEIPTSLQPEAGTHREMSIQSESTVPSLSSCLDDFSHESSAMSHGQECKSEQLELSRPSNAMHQRVLEQRARRSPSPSPRNRDEVSVPGNQWVDQVPINGRNDDSKAQLKSSTSEGVKTTESASRRLFVRFDSTVGTASEQRPVSSLSPVMPVAESNSSLGSQQKLKEISPYGFLREEYEAAGFDFPGSETASLWSSSTTQVKNGAANRPKPEMERPRAHKSPAQYPNNVENQPPIVASSLSAVSPRTRYMVAAHKKFITASPNVAPRSALPQITPQSHRELSSSSPSREVKNNARMSSAHPGVVDSIQSFPSLGSSESREEIYRVREAAARIDGTRRNDLAKQFFKTKMQASSPTMSFPEANAEMRWARSQKQMLELMKKEVAEKQVKEQRKGQQHQRSFSCGGQSPSNNSTSNESLQRRAEKVRMDLLRANLEAAEQCEGRDDAYDQPARGDDALREAPEPLERIYGNTATSVAGRSLTPSPSRPAYRKNAISSY